MLKGSQRKYLRGLAHDLKPLVQVGKEGVSPSVVDAIDRALEAHELVKVQIMAERDQRKTMAEEIEGGTKSDCAGQIGKMAIFYRQQPDEKRQKIILPS